MPQRLSSARCLQRLSSRRRTRTIAPSSRRAYGGRAESPRPARSKRATSSSSSSTRLSLQQAPHARQSSSIASRPRMNGVTYDAFSHDAVTVVRDAHEGHAGERPALGRGDFGSADVERRPVAQVGFVAMGSFAEDEASLARRDPNDGMAARPHPGGGLFEERPPEVAHDRSCHAQCAHRGRHLIHRWRRLASPDARGRHP